jgi:hypothetical protein
MAMRILAASSLSLLLAACATAPRPGLPTETPPSAHTRGPIIGLTADELVRRLGTPALQIREGTSLKLQFRSAQCVLDAYLYPSGQAPHRVTYVDTRNRALVDVDQALCIRSLEAP